MTRVAPAQGGIETESCSIVLVETSPALPPRAQHNDLLTFSLCLATLSFKYSNQHLILWACHLERKFDRGIRNQTGVKSRPILLPLFVKYMTLCCLSAHPKGKHNASDVSLRIPSLYVCNVQPPGARELSASWPYLYQPFKIQETAHVNTQPPTSSF